MRTICHCCRERFKNVHARAKHAKISTVCTDPELVFKRQLGKITHAYQVLRQLEKQQRPRKHGERRIS